MYILVYLKWIINKVLVYSTGNSAQCYVAAWMGGELDFLTSDHSTFIFSVTQATDLKANLASLSRLIAYIQSVAISSNFSTPKSPLLSLTILVPLHSENREMTTYPTPTPASPNRTHTDTHTAHF